MKNIIFIIIALVTTTSLQAQHLWKISNGGLKKPSYIFATHPYVSSNFLDSKSDVFKYFNQTTKVLGEFDSKDFEGIKVIQQNAFLAGKKSLKFFMSEEDFRFADTFLSEKCRLYTRKCGAAKTTICACAVQRTTGSHISL
jgi:hypothetical protein